MSIISGFSERTNESKSSPEVGFRISGFDSSFRINDFRTETLSTDESAMIYLLIFELDLESEYYFNGKLNETKVPA
jgi:hypothetical protein